jgi:outer membrane protein assembly factor BamB
MDTADTDLAGSTPVIIPDLDPAATGTPHLVAFGSKQGNVYLVDRDNLPGRLDQRPPCSNDPSSDPSLIAPDPRPYYGGLPGPLNVFGPYSETCTQGDYARMRTTPAFFQSADGTGYLFVSGATKNGSCSRDPVPPGLARVVIMTNPGLPAYPALDATDSVLRLFSPGPPVVTSNGSVGAIVWVLDANVYRSGSLVGANVPHPVLYAFDAGTMQLIWSSTSSQLNVGGKYNHAVVAHGTVMVGTDRIQAFGVNLATTTRSTCATGASGSAFLLHRCQDFR